MQHLVITTLNKFANVHVLNILCQFIIILGYVSSGLTMTYTDNLAEGHVLKEATQLSEIWH